MIALIKAASVLLIVNEALRISARNRLWGSLQRIVLGPVNAEVILDLGNGRSAVAVVTRESMESPGLGVGGRAAFKVSNVILSVIDRPTQGQPAGA